MLNLIIFGAPGSGKGTQSTNLAKHYDLLHVSTGELLRAETKAGTSLGKEIEALISNGQLVSDELMAQMLRGYLKNFPNRKGIVLDGYPRTVSQAKHLFENVYGEEDKTVLIDLKVDFEILLTRLLERGKVSGRSDDNEVSIKKRFKVYTEATAPVIEYVQTIGAKILGSRWYWDSR